MNKRIFDVQSALQMTVIVFGIRLIFIPGGFFTVAGLLSVAAWVWIKYQELQLRRLIEARDLPPPPGSSLGTFDCQSNCQSIGNIACKLNARSPELRCAVNPSGPCDGCKYYEN